MKRLMALILTLMIAAAGVSQTILSESITASQNTWYDVTNVTDSLFRKLEFDDLTYAADSVLINTTAHYDGSFAVSWNGTGTDAYSMRVLLNGVSVAKLSFDFGASMTGGSVTVPFYIEATAGQYLRFQICNTANSNDPTIKSAIVIVKFVHL